MIYLALTVIVIFINIFKEKSLLNSTFFFAAPYVLIILLNNTMMRNLGYYSIGIDTYRILFVFAISLLISNITYKSCFKNIRVHISRVSNFQMAIEDRTIDKICVFLYVIIIIRLINIILSIRSVGISSLYANDFEELQLSGIIGHLTLLGTVMIPYIFRHWLKSKKKRDVVVILLYTAILFASFIKYQVIILILALFFEYCFLYPQKTVKALLFFFSIVILLFIGNYWLSFLLRDINFSSSFALSKIWTYIAGGTITNDVVLRIAHNEYSLEGFFLLSISGIVNMLFYPIMRTNVIKNVAWGHLIIGQSGSVVYTTNVYSLLTYLSEMKLFEAIIISFFIGIIGEACINYSSKRSIEGYEKPTCLFIIAFIFLGFFSNYFSLSSSWEMIIWSILSRVIILLIPTVHFRFCRLKRAGN